jgi:hypothetical protein
MSSAMLFLTGGDELERRDSWLNVFRSEVANEVRPLEDEEDAAEDVVKAEMMDDRGDDGADVLTAGDAWMDASVALDTMMTGMSFGVMFLREYGQLLQTERQVNGHSLVMVGGDVGSILVGAGDARATEATESWLECIHGRTGERAEEGGGSGEEGEGGDHGEDE